MLRFLFFFYFSLTILHASLAQSPYTFGFETQLGANGDHVRERNDYTNSDGSSGFYKEYNSWSPAVGGGVWAHRRLGIHGGIQLGLHYLRQEYNLFTRNENYSSGGILNFYSAQHTQVVQHALILPLEIRFYFRRPQRQLRPFLGGQLSLGYLLGGKMIREQTFMSSIQELISVAEMVELTSSIDYVNTSAWQGLFGAQIGVQITPFTFSIWHQRNFRRLHPHYYYPCEFGGCYSSYVHPNFHRIFLNTQLRIAYQL